MYLKKQGPRVIHCRDYKRFNTQGFSQDFFSNLHEESFNIYQLDKFLNVLQNVFDIQAPIKKCYIRANQRAFMNKTLKKAAMTRSRIRNKFLNNKT